MHAGTQQIAVFRHGIDFPIEDATSLYFPIYGMKPLDRLVSLNQLHCTQHMTGMKPPQQEDCLLVQATHASVHNN
ncbi:hypothetical protein RUM43_004961 [Polyplax serrata]|uniref:Uncharacterized protein n=1 Tax=Polyplax serrata TaxID=468196 RepID=A0AAN8SEA9_POLSC